MGYAALTLACTTAAANEVKLAETELRIRHTDTPWTLHVPGRGWQIQRQESVADGDGTRVVFSSASWHQVIDAVLFRTKRCSSGETCRQLYLESFPEERRPKPIASIERKGWHVFAYQTRDFRRDFLIHRTHVSAHLYRDGVWLNFSVSSADRDFPPLEPMLQFIDTLIIK